MADGRATQSVFVWGAAPEAAVAARDLAALGYAVAWAGAEPAQGAPGYVGGCTLAQLAGYAGAFVAQVHHAGGPHEAIPCAAVIVATGNARAWPIERLGLGPGPRLWSLARWHEELARPRDRRAPPRWQARLALLLDWAEATSLELTAEALDLAQRSLAEWRCTLRVACRELKVDTQPLEALTRSLRAQGAVFSRYDNARVSDEDDAFAFQTVDGPFAADLLILPEEIRPRADAPALAQALGIRLGADGYFQDVNVRHLRPGLASRKGVYLAGRCHADLDELSAAQDAAQAAANVDALLRAGIPRAETVAVVERTLCIRCLTCVRTCPHRAVEIVREGDASAAQVFERACWGCGACVARCPVRAIRLEGALATAALPHWLAVHGERVLP